MALQLVAQLLLKTGAFSNDLKKVKGQIQNFQSGCKTAGNSVGTFSKAMNAFGKECGINLGTLTKFGGAVGAAALAGKGLKEVMESNQITADLFHNTIAAAGTSVSNLATAIGTLDFTAFYNGLDGVWRKAKDLAETLDQLGDTTLSFGVMSGELDLDVKRQQLIINDPNSTPEQVEAAKKRLDEISKELAGYAQKATEDALKAVRQTIIQKNLLDEDDLGDNFIADIFKIDLVEARDEIKQNLEAAYKTYKAEAKRIKQSYTRDERRDPNSGYKKEIEALTKQYSQQIAAYTVQVKMSNKQREELGNLIATKQGFESKSLDEQLKALKAMNKATNMLKGSGSGSIDTSRRRAEEEERKRLEEEKMLHENAVESIQAQIKAENELMLTFQEETRGYLLHRNNIIDLNKQLEETILKIEVIKRRQKEEAMGPLPKMAGIEGPKLEYKGGSGLAMPKEKTGEFDFMGGLEKAKEFSSAIQSSAMSVSLLSESLKKLREDEENNVQGWEKFIDVLSMTVNVLSTVSTLIETVNTLTKLSGAIATTAAGAEVAASGAKVAASGAETAANTAVAVSGAAASQASIPVVGPVLAVAAIAAILAAIMSATKKSNIGKYANGGIIPGSSFTGDRLTANVSSGEMILNRTQQANLFRQINNGGNGGNQVQFHISGTDLVGVLNNNNRKNKVIR